MGTEILYIRGEHGGFVPAYGAEIVEAARTYRIRGIKRSDSVASPKVAWDYAAVTLGARDAEYFRILMLDSCSRVIDFVEFFSGTIDGAGALGCSDGQDVGRGPDLLRVRSSLRISHRDCVAHCDEVFGIEEHAHRDLLAVKRSFNWRSDGFP